MTADRARILDFPARPAHTAGAAFDRMAATYDRDFTDSLIGRAQREAVWRVLTKTFHRNDNLLELNCGTGEDALFLATQGISVFACDASREMISTAERRIERIVPAPPIVFCHLPTERIHELAPATRFDGIFSNFSGLNCIADLAPIAQALSNLVKPGDPILLCLSTRICLIEIAYYLLRGQPKKALRRCRGRSESTLQGTKLTIFYPTLQQLRNSFAPHFRLRSHVGIGVAIPPSYLEPWARRHPRMLHALRSLERLLAPLPLLRSTGDHMLLRFEKVTP